MSGKTKEILEFTILYNRYKVGVYNYILKIVRDVMLCEDMVQNVFLKFYENYRLIRNKESAKYWIYTTARNEVYTFYRSKKSRVDQFNVLDSEEIDVGSSENIQYDLERDEIKNIVMKLLDKMAVEQREVYLLKEYGGLTYHEISGMMDISEDLVKSRLFKTRQKLIKHISKFVKEDL